MKFANHEEGRIILTGAPEYQYHLKDHLGNVRLTFTSKREVKADTATLETECALQDRANFLRYENARLVRSPLFDHSNGSSDGYAQRLSGGENERYGLAKSLAVMPGDTIRMQVFAKYVDPDDTNWTTALNTLMGQIAATTSGVVFDGGSYTSSTTSFPLDGVLDNSGSSGNGPMAYLNYIMFDGDFEPILHDPSQTNYVRMTDYAKENGSDVGTNCCLQKWW